MGLKETFQKAAVAGFKVAGNLVEKVLCEKTVDDGFSDSVKTVQTVSFLRDTQESKPGNPKSQFKNNGVEILITDITGSTPALLCDFAIEEGMRFTLPEGAYTVENVITDPAGALYIVLLRKA